MNKRAEQVSNRSVFTGDMRLLIASGHVAFKDLAELASISIVNKDGAITEGRVWEVGEAETVKVFFGDHNYIETTANQDFLTVDGRTVKAKYLAGEKIMPFIRRPHVPEIDYVLFGYIQGAGTLSESVRGELTVILKLSSEDTYVKEFFSVNYQSGEAMAGEDWLISGFEDELRAIGFDFSEKGLRGLPAEYDKWSLHDKRCFMRGLYTAKGEVTENGDILYRTDNLKFAVQVMHTLLEDMEVRTHLTTEQLDTVYYTDGTYVHDEVYVIQVSRYRGKAYFYSGIGFIQESYNKKLYDYLVDNALTAISVEETGKTQTVYSFNEPSTHWGVVEGVVVAN